MLANKPAMATIPVKNFAAAKAFYENLGFQPVGPQDMGNVATYGSGNSTMLVYESEYAGTNKATTATWSAGRDFDAVMKALYAAGIRFEHYDIPGGRREGDVHLFGDFKAAWFKDPDGNIHSVVNG